MIKTKKNNFYFLNALVSPRVKFRLISFSKIFKPKVLHPNSSFWKSLARFSYQLSTKLNIKLTTLAKIKNKILIKNFILNLITSNNWLSFNTIDINNFEYRSGTKLKKFLINLIDVNEKDLELISTNWVLNKIFKNFLNTNNKKKSKISFFYEKYFLKEKYTRALGISNSIKFFILKFFNFFINSNHLLKQILLFDKILNKWNLLFKLKNFKNLFVNKWFFIFFNKKLDWNFIDILPKIINSINLVDFIMFSNGLIFDSLEQINANFKKTFPFFKTIDTSFIFFFLQSINSMTIYKWLNLKKNNFDQLSKTSTLKITFTDMLSNFFFEKKNFYFYLFIILNNLIFLKVKFFFLNFFLNFFLLKCQPLNN